MYVLIFAINKKKTTERNLILNKTTNKLPFNYVIIGEQPNDLKTLQHGNFSREKFENKGMSLTLKI